MTRKSDPRPPFFCRDCRGAGVCIVNRQWVTCPTCAGTGQQPLARA